MATGTPANGPVSSPASICACTSFARTSAPSSSTVTKLELSLEEAEAAKKDMEDMLDYIDLLNELDTTGIEPMSHVFPIENVFREDVVTNGDGSADTLKNAPEQKDGGFKVPKTIGE